MAASKSERAYALALEQGTAEWLAFKAGKVGASRVADIIAKRKDGASSSSRATYRGELIAEQLTGVPTESYKSPAMQWGNDCEPMARSAYQFDQWCAVQQVGCALHPTIENALASPDGLVGDHGLVQIKCPLTATHLETVVNGPAAIPERYIVQMQWEMACTGRRWCDYVSFDPRLPEAMRIYIRRFDRVDGRIKELEAEVAAFLSEIKTYLKALAKKYPKVDVVGLAGQQRYLDPHDEMRRGEEWCNRIEQAVNDRRELI